MSRPVRAMLPSILVAVLLFQFQVAASSRPLSLSTEERQRQRADPTTPAVVHRAEVHLHHRDTAETGTGRVAAVETTTEDDGSRTTTTRAEEGGADAALSSATTTAPVGGHQQDGDGVGRSRNGRPAAALQQVLLRSRLARRFLQAAGVVEGGAGADSAAKPSCGSSDVHKGCNPPSEH